MMQVNKVNHRKEFFRVDLNHIRAEIEKLGLNAQWTMVAQAAAYRQSLAIEKAIKDNPAAQRAWMERQLELEHLDTQFGSDGGITCPINQALFDYRHDKAESARHAEQNVVPTFTAELL